MTSIAAADAAADSRTVETIVNNRVVPAAARFESEGWSIPAATPRDVALALKAARARPRNDIAETVAVLAEIGRRADWITDDDLVLISRRVGSALSYLRRSIGRLNGWLAGLETSIRRHGTPYRDGYRTEDGFWRGGLTTTMVLAGDATAVGPLALAHGMLAGARVIAKGSRYEPLAPYLFVRELMRRGLQAPDLLFFDTRAEGAEDMLRPLIENTRQSVVYGEDRTLSKIYGSAEVAIGHKKIGFWTGRSGVLVLPDADPDTAADAIVTGTAEDRGNRCYSTMKAFVPEAMMPALMAAIVARAEALGRGDPADPAVEIGRLEPEGRRLTEASIGASEVIYDRDVMFVRAGDGDTLLREEMAYPVCAIRPYSPDEDPVVLSNRATEGGMGDGALALAVITADRDAFFEAASRLTATKVVHNRPTVDLDHTAAHQGVYLFREMMRFTAAY